MTSSDSSFQIATKRGIKQGCKQAPAFFAFTTGLLFRRLSSACDPITFAKSLTVYADDGLLQMHFDDLEGFQEAVKISGSWLGIPGSESHEQLLHGSYAN